MTWERKIQENIFAKNVNKIDYASKTIDWRMSLNMDAPSGPWDMSNVVIKDRFEKQGLKFLPDSLNIPGLKKGDDYTVTADADNEGFTLAFNGTISGSYEITYSTSFDPRIPDRPKNYTNDATLTWDDHKSVGHTLVKTASVTPDSYTTNNGNKTGWYDAEKKIITWTIDINYNLYEIENAVIQDVYSGDQTFLDESLTVNELELTGGANGVKTVGDPIQPKRFEKIQNADGDGFILELGNITKAYRITYKTSLEGYDVLDEYKNNATLHNGEPTGTPLYQGSATIKPTYGGKYILKSGKQGTLENEEFAFWTVTINPSQSVIGAGAVLTDTPDKQLLIADSFKLYSTNVNANGALTKGAEVDSSDYTLVVKDNTFTLTFKKELSRAYILEYKTFINANHGETITNAASFHGVTVTGSDENGNEGIRVILSGAGGGGATPSGNLKVVKVDADNPATTLPGAVFALYDKSGKTLIKEVETDNNGVALFESLKLKTYILKEVAAPDGYVIDPDYLAGKKITLKEAASDPAAGIVGCAAPASLDGEAAPLPECGLTIGNKLLRQGFEFTKVDAADHAVPLAGAVFQLQYENGEGSLEDVAVLTSDANGKVSKGDLKPGKYLLTEMKAPKGYKLDRTPIEFMIAANQTQILKQDIENKINVGAVELLKVDHYSGEPLAGVEFNLEDAKGMSCTKGRLD